MSDFGGDGSAGFNWKQLEMQATHESRNGIAVAAPESGGGPMVRAFCSRGESEVVKGAVHAAGGVLAGLMAMYNIAAWCFRREQHLGINAVIYSLAVMWEVKQTAHHIATIEAARRSPAVGDDIAIGIERAA